MELTGKVAWVTGSTGKIGAATAAALTRMGATVYTHGTKSSSRDNHTFGNLDEDGAAKFIASNIGKIDILVCCAGGNRRLKGIGPPDGDDCLNIDMKEFRDQFDKNLMTAVHCCRAVVPGMAERGWGRVVTVGSCVVHYPRPGGLTATYAMAKAALHEYTRHLAFQVREKNVTVNCVAPSSTKPNETRTNTLSRYARPDEVANTIAFLCSPSASYVSGEVIRVNGGNIRNQSYLFNEVPLL